MTVMLAVFLLKPNPHEFLFQTELLKNGKNSSYPDYCCPLKVTFCIKRFLIQTSPFASIDFVHQIQI